MAKKVFKKEYLIDVLDLPDAAIHQEFSDVDRWSISYVIVFKDPADGKHYQTSYSVGATEDQYESPWEFDTEVECYECHEVEKLVKVWVDVE